MAGHFHDRPTAAFLTNANADEIRREVLIWYYHHQCRYFPSWHRHGL